MAPPDKIYKYVSFSEQNLENLKNNQLYLSIPSAFNDPFDCSFTPVYEEASNTELAQYYKNELKKLSPEKRAESIKEFGNTPNEKFKRDVANNLGAWFTEYLPEFKKSGICCFSQYEKEILMWSHYAKSHTGFGLEFDTQHDPFSMIEEVDYTPDLPTLSPIKTVLEGGLEEISIMYRTKYKTWEYEGEWRLFYDKGNTPFNYPPEALTGVYFGLNMKPAHKEIIALILKGDSPHTKFWMSEKSANSFAIEFRNVTPRSYRQRIPADKF